MTLLNEMSHMSVLKPISLLGWYGLPYQSVSYRTQHNDGEDIIGDAIVAVVVAIIVLHFEPYKNLDKVSLALRNGVYVSCIAR
jgi:hypothetical protein